MVSWSGHVLPFVVTAAIWFLATGLIAWADSRDSVTFRGSLIAGGAAGLIGLTMVMVSSQIVSVLAVYLSFAGALMIWGWHEIGFLTGAAAGPSRASCPPDARGFARFAKASATVIYHEIALALTALVLIAMAWNAPNQIGATVFALMFALRLASKINLFVGVPNTTTEMLPAHLSYLKSYFGPNRLTALLALSIAAILGAGVYFARLALEAGSGPEMVGASLLATLCLLGALEHVFLALPFRDGMLWGWAFRPASRGANLREAADTADI